MRALHQVSIAIGFSNLPAEMQRDLTQDGQLTSELAVNIIRTFQILIKWFIYCIYPLKGNTSINLSEQERGVDTPSCVNLNISSKNQRTDSKLEWSQLAVADPAEE